MVDTHFHLQESGPELAQMVGRAREAGVERMLAIGMTGESCRQALAAADAHKEIFVSIGRHPHESEGWDGAGLDELRALSEHPKARAVGEAGLDYKRDYAPRADQQRSFVDQVALARELGRPLVVHTRSAADDTIDLLDRHGEGVDVIIHCFSLTDRVSDCVERGWYCSFAGNVTYPKATDLHEAAKAVPDELLLAETDAPFLAPQERRGKTNEPAYVAMTARFLAELRGRTPDEMERLLDSNAARLFGW